MSANGINRLTEAVIGAAIQVHRVLGPGLLESAYRRCLGTELRAQGFRIEQERPIALVYRGVKVDCAYRLDLIVEDLVIVEIKAIEQVLPIHKAQLLSYLRLADRPVGLVINFHVTSLSRGVHRVANGFFGSSDSVQSGSLWPLRSSVASVFKEPSR